MNYATAIVAFALGWFLSALLDEAIRKTFDKLFEASEPLMSISLETFVIQSESRPWESPYTVARWIEHAGPEVRWACSCPDHRFRQRDCKHIWLAQVRRQQQIRRTA